MFLIALAAGLAVLTPPPISANPVGPVPTATQNQTCNWAEARKPDEGGGCMRCLVKADGSLEKCEVLFADPQSLAPAFLKLAPQFKMRPYTRNGQSVAGAVVVIPMHMKLPAAPSNP